MASTACPNCSAPLATNPSLFGPGKPGLACAACQTTFADGATTQSLFQLAGVPLSDVKSAVDQGVLGNRPPIGCPTCSGTLSRFVLKGIELDLCANCGTTAFNPGELWRLTGGKLGKAPASPKQGVFEMLWDCEHCDTKNLLGKTNRYCPVCGAPQDPKRRRFPAPGEESAVNTTYDGADRHCPACNTANGAKAVHCRHCGSPMDGSGEVKRLGDQVEGQSVPQPVAQVTSTPTPRKLWPFVVGGLFVLTCGFCGVATFWTKPSAARVVGHSWERVVDIERFGPVSESSWCDSVPMGAHGVSKSRKQKSTNKIPDGETCTTRNVDRGDGTFERKQECRTKYREEPVYADYCSYQIDKWSKARSVTARGNTAASPQWPALNDLRGGSGLGAEREGAHHETYTVKLEGPKGESWSCDYAQGQWQALSEGSTHQVNVRVLGGGVDCGSIK